MSVVFLLGNKKGVLGRDCPGIICRSTDHRAYLYVIGLETERTIELSKDIFLEPVKCNPKPDDMIDCIMKHGSQSEYDLGVLISSLRNVTAQIRIEGKSGKDLAIAAWNAQYYAIYISAILKCFAICYFQSDKSASEFDSTSFVNLVNRSILCMPSEVKRISTEEAGFIEKVVPIMSLLESDNRFQTAVTASWASHMNPMPAIRAMIIWGGIESLFLVDKNISNVLSEKIAQFLDDKSLEGKIKDLYKKRSKSVHELTNQNEQFMRDSEELLYRLIKRCIDLKALPPLDMN